MPLSLTKVYGYKDETLRFEAVDAQKRKGYYRLDKDTMLRLSTNAIDGEPMIRNGSYKGSSTTVCLKAITGEYDENGIMHFEALDERLKDKKYSMDSANVSVLVTKFRADYFSDCITAEQYPLLAEIWDNEDDAIYDNM